MSAQRRTKFVDAPAGLLDAIEARVRPTMRQHVVTGHVEGRISADDYLTMVGLLREACGLLGEFAAEQRHFERAAALAAMPCAGEC